MDKARSARAPKKRPLGEAALQAAIEKAERLQEKACEREARPTSWAIYAYGDASPAIGGGVGVFMWLPGKAAVADFILQTLPYSPPGPSNARIEEVIQRVAEISGELKRGRISLLAATAKWNEALRQFSQIVWIGTFKSLRSSRDEFCEDVRRAFRNEEESSPRAAAPITREELSDFREFLGTYGV